MFYLERRVLNERDGAPALVRIREVAARLCQEGSDGRDERDYVRHLCCLVVENRGTQVRDVWKPKGVATPFTWLAERSDIDTDVRVAALYTQTMPVVERWIASGEPMHRTSTIFGDSRDHAAKYHSHDVLAAMMAASDDRAIQGLRTHLLKQIALHGRVEAAQFVLGFQNTERPWALDSQAERGSDARRNAYEVARMHTPSLEVYEVLAEKRRLHCTREPYGVEEKTQFLVRCALNGWVDMAAHYISLGASLNGLFAHSPTWVRIPLVAACIKGHEGVVKLLLAHGADTKKPALKVAIRWGYFAIVSLLLEHGAEVEGALAQAVARGYKSVVRSLLEHDTSAVEWQDLLVSAIEIEDEALFRLLVDYAGGAMDEATCAVCVAAAREKGLESMLELVSSVATGG